MVVTVNFQRRKEVMAKFVEEDDFDGIGDSDVDETPAIEEDEEEEEQETQKAKTKVKAASESDEDEEEEEAPPKKKKKVSGVKSNGKEKANVKTAKTEKHRSTAKATDKTAKAKKHKAVRARRTGDRPFTDDSIVGRAFKLAEKGVSLKRLKQFLEDNETLPWVISFLRKGERNGFTWKVEEEKGMFQISALRKPKAA
jgi:hypothetical protein